MDEKKNVKLTDSTGTDYSEAELTTNHADEDNLIVIDDGCIDVPIKNQFGETTGVFRFNPTDIGIVNRYNEAADQFENVIRPLVDANIDGNGEGADDESMKILNEAGNKMADLMDYVLNGNSREAFFSKTHIFTPVNGKFYCELVYDAVGKFIAKKFDAEIKRLNARIDKHTHGYRTGKHKKGDR